MTSSTLPPGEPVTVVGAGMAGAACAIALHRAGVDVRYWNAVVPGGRMASPLMHDRRVDTGAGYFTVRDGGFRLGRGGLARPRARPRVDRYLRRPRPGSGAEHDLRADAVGHAGGLRALVRDLLGDITVETGHLVSELPSGRVVLAMPDPQAARLVAVPDAQQTQPTIAVVCGFAEHSWPFADAAFVHDHPDLAFVADDGARRGDGAPVLVAHTTPERAAAHLDRPDDAVEPVVAALRKLLGVARPQWTQSHRWTFAQPHGQHDATFGIVSVDGREVGLAGDQWCPDGSARVESAWRSGTDLAAALLSHR